MTDIKSMNKKELEELVGSLGKVVSGKADL